MNTVLPNVTVDGNGQITKLLVVVDSLRIPVALKRIMLLAEGVTGWQVAPVPVVAPVAPMEALAAGAMTRLQATTSPARAVESGIWRTVFSLS